MKYFRLTILLLILAELFSFCAFLYPVFNKVCFIAILIIAIFVSLEKLEYGLYLVFAELFIGSFGYLFFYEAGGINFSLRIGLFLTVFSVWTAKLLIEKNRRNDFFQKIRRSKIIKWYFPLFLFLIFGVINGILRKNSFNNIFFDANNFMYFALIFPIIDVIRDKEQIEKIFNIFFASMVVISGKTLFLLFIFSHKMGYAMEFLYKWMRDFRLGELTAMNTGFYRIFSQAHIFVLISLFCAVLLLFSKREDIFKSEKMQNANCKMQNHMPEAENGKFKIFFHNFALYALFLMVIILGMSRSFWVGGAASLAVLYFFLIYIIKVSWENLAIFTGTLILGLILSIMILFVIVKFPYPKETAFFSTDLFKDRAMTINDEAGSSRWNLLPPLTREIFNSPILGSGFGKTVTYKSNDPRVLSSTPTGMYTTYAFEWGYLDIILKIGIAGMLAYLWLIWNVWKEGWDRLRAAETRYYLGSMIGLIGLMIGFIAILATSIFSPYMNHPLGIGYIMLSSAVLPILCEST
ncbi:MAG: hypothetical protein V1770_02835 [bacterium]